jgi:acyl carrier protein
MDTFQTLRELISEKFDKDINQITLDASFESLNIDSLDAFDIIFDAEEAFGIKIPNAEVSLKSIGDVVALIDKLRLEQAKSAS